MSYDNGTGRHARLPPAGVELDVSVPPGPPAPRKTDPIGAVQRWWSLAVVVASLAGAGWYASQVLNGYAERGQVDAVRADMRDLDARARELERACDRLLEISRAGARHDHEVAARVDWLVQQLAEDARRRRGLVRLPPGPMGASAPALPAAAGETEGP